MKANDDDPGIDPANRKQEAIMKHRKQNRTFYCKHTDSWFLRHWKKIAFFSALSVSLLAASIASGLAAGRGGQMNGGFGRGGFMGGGMMNMTGEVVMAESPSEIVTSTVENAALSLTADMENAIRIQMSDTDGKVKIDEPGTYVISGACADGSVTVKKDTAGVVLVLDNLDLTSSKGAAISINREAQVKMIVSGSVTLTDSENPADETSADTETSDAYDGAAIKAKAGTQVVLTGDGTLNIYGAAKNGIKAAGQDSSFVVDGEALTLNITAANDGINVGADLTLLSGTVNITANDDAIHADRILTVGDRDTASGPVLTVNGTEGLEATVVNIFGGDVQVSATDDGINGTQKDDTLTPSLNITGGTITITSRTDGLDCNGNINLLGGVITIAGSASFGGEAGIDYDGAYYVADAVTLNNPYGVSGPDGGGMHGGMNGFDRQGDWDRNGQGKQFRQGDQNGQQFQPGQQPPRNGQFDQNTPPVPPMGPMEMFDPNYQPDANTSATAQQNSDNNNK